MPMTGVDLLGGSIQLENPLRDAPRSGKGRTKEKSWRQAILKGILTKAN
jgi:hypothetical protein